MTGNFDVSSHFETIPLLFVCVFVCVVVKSIACWHCKLHTSQFRSSTWSHDSGVNNGTLFHWSPSLIGLQSSSIDPQWKKLLGTVGVTNEQLEDKNTANFIYDFVEKHGGIREVNQQLEIAASKKGPPPPPFVGRRGLPPPPPRDSGPVGKCGVVLSPGAVMAMVPSTHHTSQMIYYHGGEPERAMHCWFNAWCAHECRYAWTYLKRTQLLCVICTVCEQPSFICHGPQLSSFLGLPSHQCCALAVALHRCDSGLGILHAQNYPRTFDLHEILKCAHLNFTVYGRKQTDIHTYMHTTSTNVVTLASVNRKNSLGTRLGGSLVEVEWLQVDLCHQELVSTLLVQLWPALWTEGASPRLLDWIIE